jgi:adenosine deaminase
MYYLVLNSIVMKKHVLMIAAVCLLALPTMSNDLAEQLCADEVFVSMVKETHEVFKHVQSLNTTQRELYFSSEEFACFGEKFAQHKVYLEINFNLFERADLEVVVNKAIKGIAKQTDPVECELYYNFLFMSCFSIVGAQAQAQCFANAQAWYNQCMGGVE